MANNDLDAFCVYHFIQMLFLQDCELEEFYDAFTLLAKMFKESQLQVCDVSV